MFSRLTSLLVFGFLLTACDSSEKSSSRKDRFAKDDFFSDDQKSMEVADLTNEMLGAETDFLREFASDDFPWQHWQTSVLQKSAACQTPVFLLVGNSLGNDSRAVAREFAESPVLKGLLADQFVCAVADVYVHPELALLSYHLAIEQKKNTSFPTLIWMSHEGSPIAWFPIQNLSGGELERVVRNSVAMVNDTWGKNSEYAVTNSRQDNEARQKRFDLRLPDTRNEPKLRLANFREHTRKLGDLYSPLDRDLDSVGGLLPTSSLHLLTLGAVSKELLPSVNRRCLAATTEIIGQILSEALRDQLDGSFFYTRRTPDWSLPSFSKSIEIQAKTADLLLLAGSALDHEKFTMEGLETIGMLGEKWLSRPQSFKSPIGNSDRPGSFLWNWSSLKEALSAEEFPVAITAFSLEQEGNIPAEVDPLGIYYRLNTLRFRHTVPELATELNLSEADVTTALTSIRAKLLAHREAHIKFDTESVLAANDFAMILHAHISAAMTTRSPDDLVKVRDFAERWRKTYLDPEKGLSRLPLPETFIPARATDYAHSAVALMSLYQLTLDSSYLETAKALIDEGIQKLSTPEGGIAIAPPGDRIIPLTMIDPAMIFSDSSLGLFDLALTRFKGISGTSEYDELRDTFSSLLIALGKNATINHTDFIATCALGDSPLTAILQGDPAGVSGKELLAALNSPKYLAFLSIRADDGSELFTPIKLPATLGEASVALVRDGKILGQAGSIADLANLLHKELFLRK